MGLKWYHFVVLICVSLMTVSIFQVLVSHLCIFFGEKAFALLKNRVFAFVLWSSLLSGCWTLTG